MWMYFCKIYGLGYELRNVGFFKFVRDFVICNEDLLKFLKNVLWEYYVDGYILIIFLKNIL